MKELLQDEFARGIIFAGLTVLLAIPQAYIGSLLRRLPEGAMKPTEIPKVLALVGLFLGWSVGFYTPIPMDAAIMIGVGSGWGAGTMSSHVKGAKP